jgi:hypothetical protein
MKNFLKISVLTMVTAVCAVLPSKAQLGVGMFDETRAVSVYGPSMFANPTPSASILVTNRPVDLSQYNGRGEFIINESTNGQVAGTSQYYLYSSPDTTNWSAVTNYAVISGTTSVISTNLYYGFGTNGSGGCLATNFMFMPYSFLTPTPWISFWATPYQSFNLFNNSGPVSLAPQGTTIIGYNVTDNGRYFEGVVSNTAGATSNCVFSATFLGTPKG